MLLFCFLGYSQEKEPTHNSHFGFAFSPGVIQQRNTFLEANLFMGCITTEPHPKTPIIGVSGFRIGLESDLHRTIAPKIGYEYAILGLDLKLTAANYFQDKNSEFRIIPEIGLSIGGWASLTYGYGIPLNDGNLTDIGYHRVGLSFNLNKSLHKAVFSSIESK
ncbi:hypothetical protein [Flavobacterium wongokense]|uniref:hypothetical protein n=1 Tax=Flavobacterium wongokense TaxID=2910674 RepID=UPI001F284BE6|nr:hypothetical protein [Flavobacterium sp. WG47]MCF6131352.1 hypothetical protein [Flavobacterium sp. WG47]